MKSVLAYSQGSEVWGGLSVRGNGDWKNFPELWESPNLDYDDGYMGYINIYIYQKSSNSTFKMVES